MKVASAERAYRIEAVEMACIPGREQVVHSPHEAFEIVVAYVEPARRPGSSLP